MSAKFPRGGGGAGPFLARSLLKQCKIQSVRITCVTSNFGGAQTFAVATRGCVDI